MASLGEKPTYREKLLQANREAKATVVVLVLTVLVWIAGGFGLAGLDIEIFETPIWIIGGTIGPSAFRRLCGRLFGKARVCGFRPRRRGGLQ